MTSPNPATESDLVGYLKRYHENLKGHNPTKVEYHLNWAGIAAPQYRSSWLLQCWRSMYEHGCGMRRFVAHFFPPPIRTPELLGRFLYGQANYLTQRATFEFCRNTLGYFGQHMFADPRFQSQERVCRWEGFAAVLADELVLVEGMLRPVAPPPLSALRLGLTALYAEGIAAQPAPAHRPEGAADLVTAFARRLDRVGEIEPRPVGDIARIGARRVYDVLPIYSGNETADREGIDRALLFGLISVSDQLSRRLDAAAVSAAMIAEHAPEVA